MFFIYSLATSLSRVKLDLALVGYRLVCRSEPVLSLKKLFSKQLQIHRSILPVYNLKSLSLTIGKTIKIKVFWYRKIGCTISKK